VLDFNLSIKLNISSKRDKSRTMTDWIDDEFDNQKGEKDKQAYERENRGPLSEAIWRDIVSAVKRDAEKLVQKLHSQIQVTENSQREITIYKNDFPWQTTINMVYQVGGQYILATINQQESTLTSERTTEQRYVFVFDKSNNMLIKNKGGSEVSPDKVSETVLRTIINPQ
jgi:hypothetical protein